MNFEKIIKNQPSKHIEISNLQQKAQFSQNQQNTNRTIKQSQGRQEKMMAASSQIRTNHEIPIQRQAQRLLIQSSNHNQLKQQSHLTPQERKVVGDISKLFNSESSKPTKLLIRLNQTQSNKPGKDVQLGLVAQNRLEKIQITRLHEQSEHNIMDFMTKLPTEITSNEEISEKQKAEEEISPKQSSIKIYHHEDESIYVQRRNYKVSKQISIMYVPDLNISTLIGMKNPPQLFNKFNKKAQQKCLDSVGSNFSNDFIQKKEQASNFVKLLEVDIFLKRKQIQHQRSQQLRQANEKMLSSHLIDKQNLEKARIYMEKTELAYDKKIQQLRKQLEQEKSVNSKFLMDIQARQKSIASYQKLNQQYLKQNNELKAKLKDYLKNIHELKSQLANKEKPKVEVTVLPLNFAIDKKASTQRLVTQPIQIPQKSTNDYGRSVLPKSPRKEVTFNDIYQQPDLNLQFYDTNPYYATQMNQKYNFTKMNQKQKIQPKLNNCRSQGILIRPSQASPNDNSDNKQKVYDLTSRSQKATGIRRNNLNQQPISPSTRNLVRVNKNINNDGSILIGDKLRDNKSLSSYSNLSGKSLSQRVGYISKPTMNEKNKGMLVDYMIEDPIQQKMQQRVKETAQRFKFKR